MKSTYKIVWTDESLFNLKMILEYLEQSWTFNEIQKFSQLLDKQISIIQLNPKLFAIDPELPLSIRRSVLTKHITILYRIDVFDIHVISLFDTRQNPHKKKKFK